MNVHRRFRTELFPQIEPRFNERFILSLGDCPDFIAIDDEFNLLNLINFRDEANQEEII